MLCKEKTEVTVRYGYTVAMRLKTGLYLKKSYLFCNAQKSSLFLAQIVLKFRYLISLVSYLFLKVFKKKREIKCVKGICLHNFP